MAEPSTEELLVELTELVRSRFFGKYRGIVTDTADPEQMGRIRARVPEVYADRESPWAMPSVPFAGPQRGLVMMPEEDDGVWIEFEAGDISRPIWSGCYWGSDQKPSANNPATRVIVTRNGHTITLDDDEDKIQLLHSGGPEITITDSQITLKAGRSRIVLSSSGVNINDGAFEVT
jgi:uncharacterized protein involved in type VI secretion and phage assembly